MMCLFSIFFGLLGLVTSFFAYSVAISFIAIPGLILGLLTKTKNRKLKYFAIILNIIACLRLLYIIVLINMGSFQAQNMIFEYHIPKGYSGWVQIQLENQDSPNISVIKKGVKTRYQIKIPQSGILKTNTGNIFAIRHVSEYFWTENDKMTAFEPRSHETNLAWIHCEGGNAQRHRFYVSDKPRRTNDPELLSICH